MHQRLGGCAVVGLVLAAALAGCSDPGSDGGSSTSSLTVGEGDRDRGTAELATRMGEWAVGDAWAYTFNGAETTYVVTGETATDWIMETDSDERSFSDLREDVSRLGPQRKSDLAGSQGDDRVEFFRWPLEPGKTWTTRWDQQDVVIEVLDAFPEGARLQATLADGGALVYAYTYDAEARWFGELRRFAPDGSEMVFLDLTTVTRGWTGEVVRWTLTTVHEATGSNGVNVGGPFEVPTGTTDIWAEYHFTCTGAAGWSFLVQPANPGLAAQQGDMEGGPCVQVDVVGVVQDTPHPGTWAFAINAGGQTADFAYALLLRTRQAVPFGATA